MWQCPWCARWDEDPEDHTAHVLDCPHRRLRDELLNETLFGTLAHARQALNDWKDDYNTLRPHSRLGNLPPAIYAKLSAPDMQREGALRSFGGFAPLPVASPDQTGPNEERILPATG